MSTVLEEYYRRERRTVPNSEFPPPSTITEESTPDITDSPGAESDVELAEDISESDLAAPSFQSPVADNNETASAQSTMMSLFPRRMKQNTATIMKSLLKMMG